VGRIQRILAARLRVEIPLCRIVVTHKEEISMNRAVRSLLLGCILAANVLPQAASAKQFVIGFSQLGFDHPWRVAMNDQIAGEVKKYPELKLIITNGQNDNAKQVADVENLLQQKIDLLIISPNEAAPLTAVVKKVYDAGIPVVVLDRGVLGDAYTMFIGGDNKLIGVKAGEYVAKWCTAQKRSPCNIFEITGLSGSPPAQDRASGFREGAASNPNAKVIASVTSEWQKEKALPAAAAVFQAHRDVDVVYGHNDDSAMGAYIAAKNAGLKLDKMLFVGIDGLPDPTGSIANVLQGREGASFVYPTGGAEGVDWAYKILVKGEKPPKKVTLGTDGIYPENAKEMCAKYQCKTN
jgi:ribose transport system substrate-binding protein